MIQSLLRYTSIVASAILLLSFAMFVTDQSESGTAHEVATLSQENDGPGSVQQPIPAPAPKPAAKRHGQPRKAIDDADKQLLKPFDGLVGSSTSKWVRKGVPTLLALFLFGFGLNLLAGYLPKPKPSA
jgi:hypothetical protein